MATLNEAIVILWFIPVLLQIVLPLAILVAWLILRPFGLFKELGAPAPRIVVHTASR